MTAAPHPEMRTHDCPLARAIFTAFGAACRQRQAERLGHRVANAVAVAAARAA